MEPLSEEEVLRKINSVEKYVYDHQNTLSNSMYNALEGISESFLAYKDMKGKPGWAKKTGLWTDDEAKLLESSIERIVQTPQGSEPQGSEPQSIQNGGNSSNINPLKSLFDSLVPRDTQEVEQSGGDVQKPSTNPVLDVTASSSLVTLPIATTFSIDEVVESIRNYISMLDAKNREIASILGPVAIIKSMTKDYTEDISVPLPFPTLTAPFLQKVDIPIPPRMILPIIRSILETCRLIISNGFVDIEILRKILSVVLAIFDITRGEWKDGVLSFMGFFGQDAMMVGQSIKTARWVYKFISPDIRLSLENDMIAGGKSFFIGAILWFASIVSPASVQVQINTMLETAKKPIDELNKKFEEIQKTAQESASKIGARVIFPKFPLEQFPSFDDIQNFQSLVHQPEIFCSPGFQEVLAPAIQVPVLRFLFELMNIPTIPEKITETCKSQGPTMEESLLKSMTPTVILPEQSQKPEAAPSKIA
jgi:hypothetical protein